VGKVVEFPYGEISNPLDDDNKDVVLEHVEDIIHLAVDHMSTIGYDIKDEKFGTDLGVIANLLFASLKRQYGEDHMLHDVLDEIHNELSEIRKILGDIN